MSDTSFWEKLAQMGNPEMISVDPWKLLASVYPAVGSIGVVLSTGMYMRATPSDSGANLALVAAQMLAVKQAAALIITTVKNQANTSSSVTKLDAAVFQLFKVGATMPSDVQKLVNDALMQHVNRLPEERRLVDLESDVLDVSNLSVAISKLTESDPQRVANIKQMYHIKSRYDNTQATQKMSANLARLKTIVDSVSKRPTTFLTAWEYQARAQDLKVSLDARTREPRGIVTDANRLLNEIQVAERDGKVRMDGTGADAALASAKDVLKRIALASTQHYNYQRNANRPGYNKYR
jgi:hypothetical protein